MKMEFEQARLLYPGTVRGLETEYDTFKKHDDWEKELQKLKPAIQREIKHKQRLRDSKTPVPSGKFSWKLFATWLNQRCWEQEFETEVEENVIKL